MNQRKTTTITINAETFDTQDEAIQHTYASGRGYAVRLDDDGRHLVAEQEELYRLEAAGVRFAYLFVKDMPDGSERVVTVPVN
jgi:hypothetical protein